MVEALHRNAAEMQRRRGSIESVDFMDAIAGKASAISVVMMLGQMNEHLEYLKGSAAWTGQLATLGSRFRSSYGEIATARRLVAHLAAHIVEHPDARNLDAKDWWYPGPDVRWNDQDGLVGVIIFGRDYNFRRVVADARSLAPDMPQN
jgi:hypothetical protein